ncbi:MAG: hypothetical protein R3Y50_02190 [Rikenellaceae bacterium]
MKNNLKLALKLVMAGMACEREEMIKKLCKKIEERSEALSNNLIDLKSGLCCDSHHHHHLHHHHHGHHGCCSHYDHHHHHGDCCCGDDCTCGCNENMMDMRHHHHHHHHDDEKGMVMACRDGVCSVGDMPSPHELILMHLDNISKSIEQFRSEINEHIQLSKDNSDGVAAQESDAKNENSEIKVSETAE